MRPSLTRTAHRRAVDLPHLEPIEPRLLLDSVPFGVADADDRHAAGLVRGGDFVLFVQDEPGSAEGAWSRQTFNTSWLPDNLTPTSATSFTDPKDGRIYHAVSAPAGLALILDDDDASLEDVRLLTDEITGAEPIASNITTFTATDGRVHLAGLTATGDLVLYAQTGDRDNRNRPVWDYVNLTDEQLAPRGIATPTFQGDLTSYATSWGALNIVGLDAGGDLQAVWIAPGLDGWAVSNLSDIAGTPTLAAGAAAADGAGAVAYLTPWDGINIAGIDPAGDLIVTWWVPQFGGDWEVTNLSDAFPGPALVPGTALAYTTPWGGLNVGGVTAAPGEGGGNLALWWWVPEFGGQWQVAPDVVPEAEPLRTVGDGAGVSSFTSAAGTTNVLGTSATGEVLRLSWRPGEAWRAENLDQRATDVDDDFDDGVPGPVDPDLAPLAGAWRVTGSGGVFDEFDIDETATIILRSDGVWTAQDGDFDLSIFDTNADSGTWDYSGGAVTITIPDTGSTRATGVPEGAASFTTRGVTLTPSGRTRLENRVDDLDDDIPFVDLRDEINDRGGLDAVLADIDLQWTRL